MADKDERHQENAARPARTAAASAAGYVSRICRLRSRSRSISRPAATAVRARARPRSRSSATTASWCVPTMSCRCLNASIARAAGLPSPSDTSSTAYRARFAFFRSAWSASSVGDAPSSAPPCARCGSPDSRSHPSASRRCDQVDRRGERGEQVEIARRVHCLEQLSASLLSRSTARAATRSLPPASSTSSCATSSSR